MSVDAERNLEQARAKYKLSADKFDTASSSIFALLDHNIPPLESILAGLCGLQDAGSHQQECSQFLICALAKSVSACKETEKKVANLSTKVADLEFLATYRDPRKWLLLRASLIGMDWAILADRLDSEEDQTMQPHTNRLKASLQCHVVTIISDRCRAITEHT